MNRIATLNVDPVSERAEWTRSTTWWLAFIAIVFFIMLRATDSEYFKHITLLALAATVLGVLAAWALAASADEKLSSDLGRRGLSEMQRIGNGVLVARHNGQKVRVRLVKEGRTQIGVWTEPYET